jgi:DNA processing protein
MQRSELGAWLRLSAAPGVGNVHARRLLAIFGSPEAVQDASHAALAQVVGERLAASIRQPDVDTLLAATLGWLEAFPDRQVIAMGDPRYPTALLQTEDPPFLIYVHGQIQALQHPRSVAVVGSRNPTPQGLENAKAFARALSQQGACVVSGLALGVDGAAHEGALEGGSPTVAVVGTGLDRVYPKRHLELARRIVQQGAMISEPKSRSYPVPGSASGGVKGPNDGEIFSLT